MFVPLVILSILLPSCRHESRTVAPVGICNHRLGPMTIAVAPAVNLSGSTAIDPERFADLMASELLLVDGVTVVPVSRVLAALGSEGRRGVESPAHAMSLLDRLGVDAILVFAVTEYDPYDPPSIGITAQLFGERRGARGVEANGESVSGIEPGREAEAKARAGLLAQSQRSYHASHQRVVQELQDFAASRGGDSSPYGWRRFTVSQAEFIRYCCHATLRSLFGGALTEGAEVHGQAAG